MSVSDIGRKIKALTKRNVLVLLGIVIISAALLIFINYYTIRIISTVRAYIHGENQYSKAQKDASIHLIMYINTENPTYWHNFQQEIQVPIGDSIARATLMKDGSEEVARQGFLQGKNHKDDLNNMIWLFQNFKNWDFLRRSIQVWKEADALVGQLHRIGKSAHEKISTGATLPEAEKKQIIEDINTVTDKLTDKETAFSENLGAAARTINNNLFYFNFVMTLLIIGGAGGYAIIMVRKLKDKNQALMATNAELDKFVYSASHDLRAPITSLRGLIEVARQEEITAEIKMYFNMMLQTLEKQDTFIQEIIDFSSNKRAAVEIKEVSLLGIIDDAIVRLKQVNGNNDIIVEKNIEIDTIHSDALRLKIITHNIISNAFKFKDIHKANTRVTVKTYSANDMYIIEIADNGIGIKVESLEHIFDMFYSTQHQLGGAGLGLYITKKAVRKLNGNISVKSDVGKGSQFTVSIPVTYES